MKGYRLEEVEVNEENWMTRAASYHRVTPPFGTGRETCCCSRSAKPTHPCSSQTQLAPMTARGITYQTFRPCN